MILLVLITLAPSAKAVTWPADIQVEFSRDFSSDGENIPLNEECLVTWQVTMAGGTEMFNLYISEQFPTWVGMSDIHSYVDGVPVITYLQLGDAGDLIPGMVPHHFTFWAGGDEIELHAGQNLRLEFNVSSSTPGTADVSNNGFFGLMDQGLSFGAGGYDENTTAIQFGSTPLLLDHMTAVDQGDHLTLNWQLSLSGDSEEFRLQRGVTSDPWTSIPLEGEILSGPGHYEYHDYDVSPGQDYWYWLAMLDGDGEISGFLGPARGKLLGLRFARLNPAFPNPFNPRTTLSYSLVAEGPMNLSIYDVRGGLVKTLASGIEAAGTHRIDWRGDDDKGRQAPSGVYFSRLLIAGESPQVEKLTLCR